MRQWGKRAGYLLVILLWLVLMSFPVVAFVLATQGQIELGNDGGNIRLFLLQDIDNQGLGFQWTRPFNDSSTEEQSTLACSQTSLRYFLWEGDGGSQNADYCQCSNLQTGESLATNSCSLP